MCPLVQQFSSSCSIKTDPQADATAHDHCWLAVPVQSVSKLGPSWACTIVGHTAPRLK